MINKPKHYHKNEIDVLTFLKKHYPVKGTYTVYEGFCIGCVHKYVARYKDKNGVEDLKKAMDYVGLLMEVEKGGDCDITGLCTEDGEFNILKLENEELRKRNELLEGRLEVIRNIDSI